MAVNKVNVRKWVDALRSGEYKQAKNYLAISGADGERSYCCLGVACEISGLGEWYDDGYSLVYNMPGPLKGDGLVLPPAVRRWFGVDGNGSAKTTDPLGSICDLPTLNDNKGYTFEQIADVIEEKLLGD